MAKKKAFFLALIVGCAYGQSVTFASQGTGALRSATGRKMPPVQLVGAIGCPTQEVKGARIWQLAAQNGYPPLVQTGGDVLRQAAGRDWRVYAMRSIQIASIAAMSLIASGGIAANAAQLTGLTVGHAVTDQVLTYLKADAPSAEAAIGALIDPSKTYGPGCFVGLLVSPWSKGVKYPAVTVAIP